MPDEPTNAPSGGEPASPPNAAPTQPPDSNAAAALAAVQAAIAASKSALNGGTPAPAQPSPSGPGAAPSNPMADAIAAMASDGGMSDDTSPKVSMPSAGTPVSLPKFDRAASKPLPKGMDLLSDVNLNVKIELGRTRMLVEDVLKLNEGAVVELDKLAGDPVDVFVNDRPIARGEILVLNDNFCVRINEIIPLDEPGAKPGKGKSA